MQLYISVVFWVHKNGESEAVRAMYVNDVFHFEQRLLYSLWNANGMAEQIPDDAIEKSITLPRLNTTCELDEARTIL